MNGNKVVRFAKSGKPDQQPHFPVNFINFFIMDFYFFRFFKGYGLQVSDFLGSEPVKIFKKSTAVSIAAKPASKLGRVFKGNERAYRNVQRINPEDFKILGLYELERAFLPEDLFGKGVNRFHFRLC